MSNHPILARLIDQSQAGNADAGEALAYVFSGVISAALPELGLGFHRYEKRNNYRKLRWTNESREEVVRVDLVGDGAIRFQVYDHDGDRWGGTTFPGIDEMIRQLKRIGAAPRSSRSASTRAKLSRRSPRTAHG